MTILDNELFQIACQINLNFMNFSSENKMIVIMQISNLQFVPTKDDQNKNYSCKMIFVLF